jgi:hypothetical protein
LANSFWFQFGLLLGVIAGLFATASFFRRRYPALKSGILRDRYLQQPPERARLVVLGTEITMISKAAKLKLKGLLMRLSLIALAEPQL